MANRIDSELPPSTGRVVFYGLLIAIAVTALTYLVAIAFFGVLFRRFHGGVQPDFMDNGLSMLLIGMAVLIPLSALIFNLLTFLVILPIAYDQHKAEGGIIVLWHLLLPLSVLLALALWATLQSTGWLLLALFLPNALVGGFSAAGWVSKLNTWLRSADGRAHADDNTSP